MYQYMYN